MGSLEEQVEKRQPSKLEEKEEEEAFMYAMQLASFSVLPMVLKSVIELDILEIIAKAGAGAQVSPLEIAAHLPTHNPDTPVKLDRILRLLASYNILDCSQQTLEDGCIQRLYGLTPVSKFLIKNEDGVSIAPLVLMNQDRVALESWHNLKDTVIEGGIPFNKGHGMASFEYNGIDPRFNKIFNIGMSNHSTLMTKKILDIYKGFEGVTSLVDVGGGLGATLHMIVSKYPSISGINFDLPHVIADAPSYPGIDHVSGDMFVSVPKADAIFMKWICHDWSDHHCLQLLKNCHDALPDDGKVILVERILPSALETTPTTQGAIQSDCIMLAYNPGGKERTQEEFEAQAKGAGFSGFRVVCRAYDNWIMEFLKKD